MIDFANVITISRKELYDALRNRWFLLFTFAFTGLALALSLLGQPTGGQLHLSNYGRTTASLVNLVLLFVPLIGLTLGAAALASDRETGALDYLLSQPVTHTEVLFGKYLGLAGALLASLLVGFGVAGAVLITQNQASDAGGYILTVGLACLLALAMLSVGFFISATTQKTATALGGGLFVWLLLVFVGDLGLMGTAIITRMPIEAIFYIASINPLQMFKMATILNLQANLEVLGPVGLYATEQFGGGLFVLLLVGLFLWIIVPLLGAISIFATGHLLPFRRRAA